jgi:hypothetical protein
MLQVAGRQGGTALVTTRARLRTLGRGEIDRATFAEHYGRCWRAGQRRWRRSPRGAPLSHAAIVARELGIPAVVGCGNATMRLRTGDLVRVDGSHGTVERVAPPAQGRGEGS